MVKSFQLTFQPMDWFRGLCRMLNHSNAVTPLHCCLILAITVRSPEHERILRQEWATAEKVGVDWSQIQWDKV